MVGPGGKTLSMWLVWVAATALSGQVLSVIGIPAPMLLGGLIAGAVMALRGAGIRMPTMPFQMAQALVAVMIAGRFSAESLSGFAEYWHLALAVTAVTLAWSVLVGAVITKSQVLPGSSALWGTMPGAAAAMVVLAGAHKADMRIVATMQYYRLLVVTLVTTGIATLGAPSGDAVQGTDSSSSLVLTLGIAAAGWAVGRGLRLPAPAFLGPLAVGIAAALFGADLGSGSDILLMPAFAVIGGSIGLNFDDEARQLIKSSFWIMSAGIAALILFCAGSAVVMHILFGIDLETAYLATSPGGMDVVAILAAESSRIDIALVMTFQLLRFLFVLAVPVFLERRARTCD